MAIFVDGGELNGRLTASGHSFNSAGSTFRLKISMIGIDQHYDCEMSRVFLEFDFPNLRVAAKLIGMRVVREDTRQVLDMERDIRGFLNVGFMITILGLWVEEPLTLTYPVRLSR